mgnify:CR=1 FL=1
MKKFNIFLIIYFIMFFLLLITNAIIETMTEYSLIIFYYPYFYYLAVGLVLVKFWELLFKWIIRDEEQDSIAMGLFKGVTLVFSFFATLFILLIVAIACGSTSSEKYEDLDLRAYASPNKLNKTEYIVVERGVLAATTIFYHERHNLFLVKKKESYSHKI